MSSRKIETEYRTHLPWHRISVLRSAIVATVIMIGGYLISLITINAVNRSLSKIAYDAEIEQTLESHLQLIKDYDQLYRQNFLQRLSASENIAARISDPQIVRQILEKADVSQLAPAEKISIESLQEEVSGSNIQWLTRSRLRFGQFLVTIPSDEARQRFEAAEAIKQRYQLIRGTWDDQIGPAFIRVHGLIIAGSFFVLGATLFFMARRYRSRTGKLISGMTYWSEVDPSFRFASKDEDEDEIDLIANQFNQMATEVEVNRRRSLYLEKISSWQIIAKKMAHEIKNPLTPIQMMVSHVVQKYSGSDQNYRNLLTETHKIIDEEVSHLRRMVDHFSQFASLPQPKFEKINIVDVCHHVLELQRPVFPGHQFQLLADLEQAVLVKADPQLLKQVLLNLTKNAAENQDEGLHIAIDVRPTQTRILVDISDDGPGIQEEDFNRIFEAYFTTKHTGSAPGMGLGLAICKKIMIDHGGEIMVKSQAARTQFTISLPIYKEE
ncbi:MAG: sensor histidine kinase [Oligoflexus sp.]